MKICLLAFWILVIFPEPEDLLGRLIHKAKPAPLFISCTGFKGNALWKYNLSTNNTNFLKVTKNTQETKSFLKNHIIFKPQEAVLWIQDWHNIFQNFSQTKMFLCIWKVFAIFAIITVSLRCTDFDLVHKRILSVFYRMLLKSYCSFLYTSGRENRHPWQVRFFVFFF